MFMLKLVYDHTTSISINLLPYFDPIGKQGRAPSTPDASISSKKVSVSKVTAVSSIMALLRKLRSIKIVILLRLKWEMRV